VGSFFLIYNQFMDTITLSEPEAYKTAAVLETIEQGLTPDEAAVEIQLKTAALKEVNKCLMTQIKLAFSPTRELGNIADFGLTAPFSLSSYGGNQVGGIAAALATAKKVPYTFDELLKIEEALEYENEAARVRDRVKLRNDMLAAKSKPSVRTIF
jgi:hypothetical protein